MKLEVGLDRLDIIFHVATSVKRTAILLGPKSRVGMHDE